MYNRFLKNDLKNMFCDVNKYRNKQKCFSKYYTCAVLYSFKSCPAVYCLGPLILYQGLYDKRKRNEANVVSLFTHILKEKQRC